MTSSANEPGFWVNRVSGKNGLFGLANEKGVVDAVKQNMKWEVGNKKFVLARTFGVAAGFAAAGDALFNSKTADGEDRSALARIGQGVLGLGVAAGSLAAGKGR